jgi:hypothetical protein
VADIFKSQFKSSVAQKATENQIRFEKGKKHIKIQARPTQTTVADKTLKLKGKKKELFDIKAAKKVKYEEKVLK